MGIPKSDLLGVTMAVTPKNTRFWVSVHKHEQWTISIILGNQSEKTILKYWGKINLGRARQRPERGLIMMKSMLGPMKGVFPTPDNGPFFPSDTDIQPKLYVARHWHSELITRHLTLHFSLKYVHFESLLMWIHCTEFVPIDLEILPSLQILNVARTWRGKSWLFLVDARHSPSWALMLIYAGYLC